MIYPLHVKARLARIPVGRLVGRHDRVGRDPFPRELDILCLAEERPRQRPTTALPEYDNNTPLSASIGEPAAIDAIFPQIGGPDVATEGCAIHLDLAVETKVPCLGQHRFY